MKKNEMNKMNDYITYLIELKAELLKYVKCSESIIFEKYYSIVNNLDIIDISNKKNISKDQYKKYKDNLDSIAKILDQLYIEIVEKEDIRGILNEFEMKIY